MFLLLAGTILNTIIGISFGLFDIWGAFSFIGDGTTSMANTIIVALLAGGLLLMVRYNGGISYIINKTQYLIKNKKSCEFGITFLVGIINLFTANNTVAIITAGPIAKRIINKIRSGPQKNCKSFRYNFMLRAGNYTIWCTNFNSNKSCCLNFNKLIFNNERTLLPGFNGNGTSYITY